MRTAFPVNGSRSTGAKKRADVLMSKIVRARGHCESCGETNPARLQCAHIVSRRFNATRCLEANLLCLCSSCHMRYTEWPLEFANFVVRRIGEPQYEALKRKAQAGAKVDWESTAKALAERWQALT